MGTKFSSIDTGENTIAAQNYAAKAAKLLASLEEPEVETKPAPKKEVTVTTTQPTIVPTPKEASLVEALGLQESNETVEVILNFTANTGAAAVFSVTVKPIAINVTEDCVTLLIDSSVNIKPPTLLPLTIKKSGILYTVVYAGTILQTPKLNVLSFLRTSNS